MSDYLKEARKAKRQGDYAKAGDFYNLAGDDKSALEMYLAGGNYGHAARILENKEDWNGAAKLYVQSGKFKDAGEIYCNKLKDYRMAGAMFEKSGDFLLASQMAQKTGELARAALLAEQGDFWERAATLYVEAERYERAAEVYRRLLKSSFLGEDKRPFEGNQARLRRYGNSAGNLYFRIKQYETAARCFLEVDNVAKAADSYALAQKPEEAAELYYRLQEYDKAYELLAALGDGCQNKELYADVCYQQRRFAEAGEIYLSAGRMVRAAEAYEAAEDYDRAALFYESLEDYSHAAEIYLKLNDPKKAAELFERAKNHEYAARLYEEINLPEKAADCLLHAGEHVRAARMLIEKSQFQQAVSILQQISPLEDDYREGCIFLGQLFAEMEMYSAAVQKLTEGLNKQPLNRENIGIYYTLAVAYERAAQYSRAKTIYEAILSLEMGYEDVRDRLHALQTSNLLDSASAVSSTSVKRMISARYELTEKIGQDAFGVLYKAGDISLGRPVMIRRFPNRDQHLTMKIIEQTKIVSMLTHSNILAIYDSGKDGDHYFIATEYVEGPTLRQYLAHGPIDISEVCEIASQICLALGYAHKRGIVHRNLSPENIYLCKEGPVKVANFGIESRWGRVSTLISKQYLSPEHILEQKLDGRSDLYAFGIILFEMIYGTPPFSGEDVEFQHVKSAPVFRENPHRVVPPFLVQMMRKCLSKDRSQRYASSEEIVEQLEVADIVPGMVLNQRYEILRQLGSGGMGHVYQARDRDLDEIVALKVLRAEVSADPLIQKRFFREIKVTRMITHPNVVKVFDIGKYKGNRYLSMEYIDGPSLDDWLRCNPSADPRVLLTMLVKILQAVQAAHNQGVIHRDLKPQNVLIDYVMNPHILDFGIARSKDHVDATIEMDATGGQVLGSPKYMSPEQIQGKDLDKRSDIYSLGVLMFYMFAGEEPFVGDEPRAIIMKHLTTPPPTMSKIKETTPAWLEAVVMKALEKERNRRYASIKEILDDLKRGYETEGVRQ